jgi:hypothetical protein
MPSALVVLRNNKRIYVERAGAVFYGWTGIPATLASARLNNEAWVALRAQFPGVTEHTDPSAPVAVESGSWLRDLRDLATGFSYRINKSFGFTSGTGSEIRVSYNCSASPNGECNPAALPAPDNFTRNRLFLVSNVWKDSDADGACPSNGVNLSTWTSSPRESVGCGGQTESITSLDSDISGRTFASVFAEGRAYSGKAYGSDPRNWAGNPSDPDNAIQKFPAGSKLRFQQSTIKSASPSIGISNGSKVLNWSYNTATQTSSNVDASSLAAMIAHHDGVPSSSKAGPGNWSIQLYSHQLYGTPAAGTTGLRRYRAAFTPSTATSGTVKYYGCDTQVTTNYSINCELDNVITAYTISVLGGKNVLNFAFDSDQIKGISDEQKFSEVFFAEHNGKVYYARKDFVGSKHSSLRLNQTAYEHMLYTTWGLPRVTVTPTAP